MAVLKCKMCGGTLEVTKDEKIVTCEYCNTTQTIPTIDSEKKTLLYNRANAFRLRNEFDKAMVTYENIVEEFTEDSEAYWGLVLCKYGIEYVDDPKTGKKIPTCHRTLTKSILNDDDYLNAVKYSDVVAKALYEQEAKEIDRLQNEILVLSQKEEPYDIFICYKETDNLNKRTIDSVIAQDIYDELTKKGYKVFFARITLESKLGSQYEPIIYAALNSSKAMLVIGTKPEYFNAVWVRNEWSRYIDMINHSNNQKYLIPCYKDMDAYDLPEEMLRYQCQDLNKLGYMQDLIRGLDKIFDRKPKVVEIIREKVIETKQNVQYVNNGAYQNTAIREDFVQIKMFLEMGNFEEASKLVNKLLAKEMINARLWIFSLLAQLQIKNEDLLGNHTTILTNYNQYNKALEYADSDYKQFLIESNNKIVKKKEDAKKEERYKTAVNKMNNTFYEEAVKLFTSLEDYKDSKTLLNECQRIIDEFFAKGPEVVSNTLKECIEESTKDGNIDNRNIFRYLEKNLNKYKYKIHIDYDKSGGKPYREIIPGTKSLVDLSDILCNFVQRDNHKFNGWKVKIISSEYDDEKVINVNIMLYAKMIPTYTIKFEIGTKIIEEKFSDPKKISLLMQSEKVPKELEKKIFVGWFDENGNEVTELERKDYYLKAKFQDYQFVTINGKKCIYFGFAPEESINHTKVITPILWDIVEEKDNVYKLVTAKYYGKKSFYTNSDKRFKKFRIINPSNYEFSDIRAYLNSLNSTKYNGYDYTNEGIISYFSSEQLLMINKKPLKSLLKRYMPVYGGSKQYDYLYLLSSEDLKNPKIDIVPHSNNLGSLREIFKTFMLRDKYDANNICICQNGGLYRGYVWDHYYIRFATEITIKKC